MNNKFLTILIPSCEKEEFLKATLESFLNRDFFKHMEEIEILIADNSRTNNVFNAVCEIKENLRCLTYYRHQNPTDCAEENINEAWKWCAGKYIWTMGDDDRINFSLLEDLLIFLKTHDYDFVHAGMAKKQINCFKDFNERKNLYYSETFIPDSYLVNHKEIKEKIYESTFKREVITHGVITYMCFISLYIFKKSIFKNFNDYINISSSYSLVFGFIEMLHEKKIALFHKPLVIRFRSECVDFDNRLKAYTKKKNISLSYPWSFGLLGLASRSVKKGHLTWDEFFQISETSDHSKVALYKNFRNAFSYYFCEKTALSEKKLLLQNKEEWMQHVIGSEAHLKHYDPVLYVWLQKIKNAQTSSDLCLPVPVNHPIVSILRFVGSLPLARSFLQHSPFIRGFGRRLVKKLTLNRTIDV